MLLCQTIMHGRVDKRAHDFYFIVNWNNAAHQTTAINHTKVFDVPAKKTLAYYFL
jgi:hypothetical protein